MSTTAYQRKQDEASCNAEQLLTEYLPMIRYHAGQLIRRVPNSVEMDDLIDSGVLGLLDAAQRFDSSRNVQFKTFAGYRVRGAMIDYIREFDWLPRGLRDSSKQLQRAMLELEQRHGRPAEEQEIAAHLGVQIDEYRNRLQQVRGMAIVYFDDLPVVGDDEDVLNILESIENIHEQRPEHQTAMRQFSDKLAECIEALPTRERILLTLYYFEELNMKEVALILNLTESRISQIHSQMVLRIRSMLNLDIAVEH
ncbi:MAG: FliA/WhiG family RNA polymerase sigma factor [Mariprofundaceae bacterium]|nr:FliA/WhiG family RNA polymerase sigma factor [Mariprofundaceae bacterium]